MAGHFYILRFNVLRFFGFLTLRSPSTDSALNQFNRTRTERADLCTAMSKTVIHRASERGHADHGWLDAWHSFSFASWYEPNRMHFGVLRVLNDDTVAPGMGFGMHPHDNMEIITIPLEGALQHKDNMGNTAVVQSGDVQVMSAGIGVLHSEFNPDQHKRTKLLQIWLFPKTRNVEPRYQQITTDVSDRVNKFQQVVSPDKDGAGTWIHQDAWFQLGKFDAGRSEHYAIKRKENGVYVFVLEGEVTIEGQAVGRRDAMGVWDADSIDITTGPEGAEVLLMDVPMN